MGRGIAGCGSLPVTEDVQMGSNPIRPALLYETKIKRYLVNIRSINYLFVHFI